MMADETNLSSKLPVADRTREVWGRKLCWCVLALAFRCAHVSARLFWFFLLHIHQHPFLWGLATLLSPLQSVPMTLLEQASVAQLDAPSDWRPGGRRFDPAEVGNILSWRLIMKYFLRSFSPFRWFKKGSCQFLAKECAQYWLTA